MSYFGNLNVDKMFFHKCLNFFFQHKPVNSLPLSYFSNQFKIFISNIWDITNVAQTVATF